MTDLPLAPIDVAALDVYWNPCDVLRDLHEFAQYAREREVKRSHRGNALSKADAKRIAKVMSNPDALPQVETEGYSAWVDYVDQLALQLGLVQYDIKGEYAGYSSQEPSFPENYIRFQTKPYARFLHLDPLLQEQQLLTTLMAGQDDGKGGNECYRMSILGRLQGFETWGSATGVMLFLRFDRVRRYLMDLLLELCADGVWYSTASLAAHLKRTNPYFLIPEKPVPEKPISRQRNQPLARYGNFYEGPSTLNYGRKPIPDDAPDGFERVEGRYLERFLEGIPLTLGYLDVAYARGEAAAVFPVRDRLRAFRLRERCRRVLRGQVAAPRVSVQPNFEIHVEGEIYPAAVLDALRPFARVVSKDRVTVLRLEKQRVAAALAKEETLDVGGVLRGLTQRELPQNVALELEEWACHAEAFTLFRGFALLEADGELPEADPFTVESISPALRLVHSPDQLYHQLERAERVPLWVDHGDAALDLLPATAVSVFPKRGRAKPLAKRQAKERVTLKQATRMTLYFPSEEVFSSLQQELMSRRCLCEVDKLRRTISFCRSSKSLVDAALKALRKTYTIKIEDIDCA